MSNARCWPSHPTGHKEGPKQLFSSDYSLQYGLNPSGCCNAAQNHADQQSPGSKSSTVRGPLGSCSVSKVNVVRRESKVECCCSVVSSRETEGFSAKKLRCGSKDRIARREVEFVAKCLLKPQQVVVLKSGGPEISGSPHPNGFILETTDQLTSSFSGSKLPALQKRNSSV